MENPEMRGSKTPTTSHLAKSLDATNKRIDGLEQNIKSLVDDAGATLTNGMALLEKQLSEVKSQAGAVNLDALVDKVEIRLAAKFMGTVNSLRDELVQILPKLIEQQTAKQVESAFKANQQAFVDELKKSLPQVTRQQEGVPEAGADDGRPTGKTGFEMAKELVRETIGAIGQNAEGIKALWQLFHPPPSTDQQIANMFRDVLRGFQLGLKARDGRMSPEDVASAYTTPEQK